MWQDGYDETGAPADAGPLPNRYPSHPEASSQPTPSPTLGSQMEFPLLSSQTGASWLDARTERLRRFAGLDPLFWEGILG